MTNIIDDILIIQESYVVGIRKDADDAHWGDMLETIFQDSPHLNSSLVVEKSLKAFLNKLLN